MVILKMENMKDLEDYMTMIQKNWYIFDISRIYSNKQIKYKGGFSYGGSYIILIELMNI